MMEPHVVETPLSIPMFLCLALFAIVVLGMVSMALWQFAEMVKTRNSPMQKAQATVVTKRSQDYGSHDHHSTRYFCTFEFRDGRRIELKCSGRQYGMLVEDDSGIVVYQRNRFRDFQRHVS